MDEDENKLDYGKVLRKGAWFIVFLLLFIISFIIFFPLGIFWALKVLHIVTIEFTLLTWFAFWIILMAFVFMVNVIKK